VFPVRRGQRDEEAFKTADAILRRGGLIVMYVEGGRSRSGELGTAKPGIGRLALEYGVPIVPTAIAGTERVRNWKRLQFPKVTVQFGDPIRFEQVESPTREQSQAASEIVFEDVRALHSRLRTEGRRSVVRAARAARRAAGAAARRPVTR
jgi:1-acyl-sn-glycerol-3-phosphate acyltransferase